MAFDLNNENYQSDYCNGYKDQGVAIFIHPDSRVGAARCSNTWLSLPRPSQKHFCFLACIYLQCALFATVAGGVGVTLRRDCQGEKAREEEKWVVEKAPRKLPQELSTDKSEKQASSCPGPGATVQAHDLSIWQERGAPDHTGHSEGQTSLGYVGPCSNRTISHPIVSIIVRI